MENSSSLAEKRRLVAQKFLRSIAQCDDERDGDVGDQSLAGCGESVLDGIDQIQVVGIDEQPTAVVNRRRIHAAKFLQSLSLDDSGKHLVAPQPIPIASAIGPRAAALISPVSPNVSTALHDQHLPPYSNSNSKMFIAGSIGSLASSSSIQNVEEAVHGANVLVPYHENITAFSNLESLPGFNASSSQQQQQQHHHHNHALNHSKHNAVGSGIVRAKVTPQLGRRRNNVFMVTRIRQSHSTSNKPPASIDIIHSQSTRIFLTSPAGIPSVVYSVIRFEDPKNKKRKMALRSGQQQTDVSLRTENFGGVGGGSKRKAAESYAQFLSPSIVGLYNPTTLDDPQLKTGKHRTVITLPSYMSSLIHYTRPSDLKQELNDQLRQKFPEIDPQLTLSKIRNLKTHLLQITLNEDLEISTLAKAYVYFEKLVLKNLVTKENRKLYGGICLFLAAKVNDKKDVEYTKVLEAIEKELNISQKEMREMEFSVFVALEFGLHIAREEYIPHVERLVSLLDYNSIQDYLVGKPPSTRPLIFI